MGYGDLKLLAALGAWFGALALPWIVLLGALSGIVGVLLRGWQKRHEPLAFGPALALGAVAYWLLTLGLTKPLETIWALLLA
jgi:prepilin signal peptidase PulO-like enzyme (type II secretory pathway)